MFKDEYLKNHQTKDQRKPYRKEKAVSPSCRNHGSCPYCSRGRQAKNKRWKEKMDYIDFE